MPDESLESLKGLLTPSVDFFWKGVTEPVIRVMERAANIRIGPREIRVGVFGPYPEGGEKVITKVAKMVSELNFAAITGSGYFLPNNPRDFYEIRELIPAYVRKARSPIPGHVFFHEFPRLVSKGIFFENDERGQLVELQGCSDHEIPALGFIRHNKISGSRPCNFLTERKTHSECGVEEKELCLHEAKPAIFCPFYDSINIPWFSRQLFMTPENRLVAVRRIIALKKILKEFL